MERTRNRSVVEKKKSGRKRRKRRGKCVVCVLKMAQVNVFCTTTLPYGTLEREFAIIARIERVVIEVQVR